MTRNLTNTTVPEQLKKQSLENIYIKYYDHILNYGLKLYPNADFVKDCIQDLFVKLYSNKKLQNKAHIRAYLLKSIRNLIIDKLSKNKQLVSEQLISFHMIVDENDLEQKMGNNDEELLLLKKLLYSFDQLSENQKQVVYFRYVQDLSHKEIAEILDMNEQSSMNLLSRAMIKLRKLIQSDFKDRKISEQDINKNLILLLTPVR